MGAGYAVWGLRSKAEIGKLFLYFGFAAHRRVENHCLRRPDPPEVQDEMSVIPTGGLRKAWHGRKEKGQE